MTRFSLSGPPGDRDFRATLRNLVLGLRAALTRSARKTIRENFHRALYLDAYPDVAESKWPALLHYALHGYREMRDPGPAFSTAWYLRRYDDVLRQGLCPLLHYAIYGRGEGRPIRASGRFVAPDNVRGRRPDGPMELCPADRPLVSVVVPCFNYGETLRRCLDSLARQTFRDFEVLVIEGGSDDPASIARVKQLEDEKPFGTRFLYRSSPCMAGDNRNYGIAAAKGKYICCLDADDLLHPVFLEASVFLAEAEDWDIVSPSVRCFGDSEFEWILQAPSLEKLLEANCIATAALFRRTVWEKTGGYRDWGKQAAHIPEDWDFWIRALASGFRATALTAPLHHYCVHEGGLSSHGDGGSNREKLQDSNREILAAPQPVRMARCFTNPLVNLNRVPVPGLTRGVLFCIPWITQGGAENHLRTIAAGLQQAGLQPIVVTTAELLPAMPDDAGRFECSGVVVYSLPDLLANHALWPLFLEELLHRHNVDTLFLCGSEYIYPLLPALLEHNPALRIVDQLFNDEGHLRSNRRFASFIDLTVVQSISLRDTLLHTYRESSAKVRLIPQALLPSFDDRTGLNPELMEAIRGRFVVSFIGRFSPEKAPEFFLRLALQLAANPEYFFFFIGDGPLRRQVLDGATTLQPRLHAPGAVRNARTYMAHSNVVVVPSTMEGMPGVVLESLAEGRAVVASRVGAIPEVIQHGVNGFLCDSRDIGAFFRCIERLRSDAGLRAAVEANARESARGGFGLEAMMESYLDCLMAAPRAAP
jgi:glycosyltransferase involved in cell wall biosynthesis